MITDLQNTNNNWIYQSNKLVEASYTLTVTEQKLIRLLASIIKKDDDDLKEYEFKTKDLIKVLNTSDGRFYRDIDNITDLLMQRIIKIKDKDLGSWEKYHWVDTAKYNNGVLKLKIHKDLKPFYLGLDWYSKYQLKNIMQFKSTYSFRLYELLKQYENIKYRIITIEDLRIILDIDKKQYQKYANLKQKVIKVAVGEINSNTDLHIEIEELKEIRKITAIKFYIKSNNKNEAINEISATVVEPQQDLELIKKVKAIMNEYEISDQEALAILKSSEGDLKMIKMVYDDGKNKDIPNFIGWMIQLVKPGVYQPPKRNVEKHSFNNYEQRTYDYNDLEKKLLGWESN